VGMAVGAGVALWSLSRAFLAGQAAPSRLGYIGLIPMTVGGARLGDLIYGARVNQRTQAERDHRTRTLGALPEDGGALDSEQIREIFGALGSEQRSLFLASLDGKQLLALKDELTWGDGGNVDTSLQDVVYAIVALNNGNHLNSLTDAARALLEQDPVLKGKLPAQRG